MYDIKIAIPGGFAIIHSHSDHIEVTEHAVDEDMDASAIAFMGEYEPVSVHDCLGRLPRAPAHNGKIRVIVAHITNEYGMPAAVVCDSIMYVVNADGKTVSTHRA